MPELPEVQTVVAELNRKLKNLTVKSVAVNAPKMISIGPRTVSNIRKPSKSDAGLFPKLLAGRKVLSVSRRAKLLIFNFSGSLSMLVHLKMTGQFIFEDKKLRARTGGSYRLFNKMTTPFQQLPSKHTHVIFNFANGSVLYFNDVRKFGYLKLLRGDEINKVRELKEFGPEPLGKEFTLLYFFTAVKKYSNNIKSFLMNPKIIAGIGNIYSDEILFHAKVRPTRAVGSLGDKELKNIYKWVKPVLHKGIKAKGSSVGDFVRTDGSWGKMGKYHFVYGRKGQKCKTCGSIIESVKLNGRTGSYCPVCQN